MPGETAKLLSRRIPGIACQSLEALIRDTSFAGRAAGQLEREDLHQRADLATYIEEEDYIAAGTQSFAMLAYGKLLWEMVRTGEANAASGLSIVLAWILLLAGGVLLVIGARRPRYNFAASAVFGFLSLSQVPYSSSSPER